jgi:hypothetical protein
MSTGTAEDLREFGIEPVRGLPGLLPPGETILWQGRPEWKGFAVSAFFVTPIALYFAALAAWRLVAGYQAGDPLRETWLAAGWVMAAGLLVAAGAIVIGWYAARTTCYTITNRRVAFRIGMALTIHAQIPFTQISSASLKLHRDGSGDIALSLLPPARVSWLMFWPHTRPWRLSRPQPAFRNLPDAERAAQVLARALAASAAMPAPVAAHAPRPAPHGAAVAA